MILSSVDDIYFWWMLYRFLVFIHYPPVTRCLALCSETSNAGRWEQYNRPLGLEMYSTFRMEL